MPRHPPSIKNRLLKHDNRMSEFLDKAQKELDPDKKIDHLKQVVYAAEAAYKIPKSDPKYAKQLSDTHMMIADILIVKLDYEKDPQKKISIIQEAVIEYEIAEKFLAPLILISNLSNYRSTLDTTLKDYLKESWHKAAVEQDLDQKIAYLKQVTYTEEAIRILCRDNQELLPRYTKFLSCTYAMIAHTLVGKANAEEDLFKKIPFLKEAIEASSKALKLTPKHPILEDNLANCHYILAMTLDDIMFEDASKTAELLAQAIVECQYALNLQPKDEDNIALMKDIMGHIKPIFHESQTH